jgi:hypothetical protein
MRWALVLLGLGAWPVLATPLPGMDVPAMVAAADLVVVGRAEAVRRTPRATEFRIDADRVLKGAASAGAASPSVRLDASVPDFVGVVERQYGVFFLRRNANGYAPVDPYRPAIVASPAGQPHAAGDPDRAVAAELAAVLASPAAVLVDPESGVQSRFVGSRRDQAERIYEEAANALMAFSYATAGPALRRLMSSGASHGRLWALYALLHMDDASGIEALRVRILKGAAPDLLEPPADARLAVTMVAHAMEGRLRSRAAQPILRTLLDSREAAVRRAAGATLAAR